MSPHGARQHGDLRVDAGFLHDELRRDASDPNSSHDLGKAITAYLVKNGTALAHSFSPSCVRNAGEEEAYWRDVGTCDANFEANLDLTNVVPALDIYEHEWPIWTYAEIGPPAKFVHDEDGRRGTAVSSSVSGGCIVSGASLRRSLLFTRVHVRSYAMLEAAVALPDVHIELGARLRRVVIDRGDRIPEGLVVSEGPVRDARRFRRTDNGVCLTTQPMIDRLAAG